MTYAFHRGEVTDKTIYPAGLTAIESGEIDWEADNIKALLVTSKYWPSPQHRYYSDIAHEAEGIGYPRGGFPVTWRIVLTRGDGSRALDAADVTSPVMTLIARSIVFYKDTGDLESSPLICCMRFDEDQKLVHGIFTLEGSSEGLLSLPAAEPTDETEKL